ncbi:hypothetical protein N658DRAFT_539110 [Parathielavia hyrcaniae]|uniref:Uncharacterized protein n=1 Tax=Parathielavia hyrcaniae TaxID=113614 RepID=A0AAN6PXP0_9PEZI|nr:hypothetical protein N658DRAFT_539110 [Parathielavia hyrcaniae]
MAYPPSIGALKVYGENGQELDPTSTRHRIVEAFVHLALCLLETEEGQNSLAEVATTIIKEREGTSGTRSWRPRHIYRDSLANMPYWIRVFLRTAGHLEVSQAIISNMTYVRQHPEDAADAYDLFKFQMAITVAHEIVHMLTGFITGTSLPDTPPNVNVKPYIKKYGKGVQGEAGRYWESIILGGFVEFWSVPNHPLGMQQAGEPYLFLPGEKETAQGREVSRTYIKIFLREDFTSPIRPSSQSIKITRKCLEKEQKRKETSYLRSSAASRQAEGANSPPAAHPSAELTARFRRINLDADYGYAQLEGPSRGYFYR